MGVFIKDRSVERISYWVWLIRLLTLGVVFAAIGLTAELSKGLTDIHCKISPKMGFNLAVGALTLLIFIYTLLSSSPKTYLRVIPFSWILFLTLDGLLLVLWAAAAGTATVSCSELCNACASQLPDYVRLDTKACTCTWNIDILDIAKRDTSPVPLSPLQKRKGGSGHGSSGGGKSGKSKGKSGSGSSGSNIDGRLICDALTAAAMAVLLLATFIYYVADRKASKASNPSYAPAPAADGPSKQEEAGMITTESAPPYAGYPQQQQPEQGYGYPQQTQVPAGYPQQQPYSPPPPQRQQTAYSGAHGAAQSYYAGDRAAAEAPKRQTNVGVMEMGGK